jgi:hypothetical protein
MKKLKVTPLYFICIFSFFASMSAIASPRWFIFKKGVGVVQVASPQNDSSLEVIQEHWAEEISRENITLTSANVVDRLLYLGSDRMAYLSKRDLSRTKLKGYFGEFPAQEAFARVYFVSRTEKQDPFYFPGFFPLSVLDHFSQDDTFVFSFPDGMGHSWVVAQILGYYHPDRFEDQLAHSKDRFSEYGASISSQTYSSEDDDKEDLTELVQLGVILKKDPTEQRPDYRDYYRHGREGHPSGVRFKFSTTPAISK